jgi:hypothetical protein
MKWPLMSDEELHAFGIDIILPYLVKEGVTIEEVNRELGRNPQIVGKRWDLHAFIFVCTAMYPDKGTLTEKQFMECLAWSDKHHATAFFASVGCSCDAYPDKSSVTNDGEKRLPIRHAGFLIAYEGLLIMTTSDRVKLQKGNEEK